MNPATRRMSWVIGAVLLCLVLCVALALILADVKSGTGQQNRPPPVIGQVQDFTLTNENGGAVSLADLHGHPWVADIIFTRCAGPCPRMTRQMKELQDALPAASEVRLVSLTTDPDYDTPTILSRYAERFGADTNRWMFLTGTKEQLGNLATGSLKLSAVPKTTAERDSVVDLFVHSTIFVVVDRQARLRGIFQTGGGGVNWSGEKQKILATLEQLENDG